MIFSPCDPFNRQIPQPDPDSDALSRFFVAHAGSANLASDETWGIPVYRATILDSYVTVRSSKFDAGASFGLRLPAGVKPSTGEGKVIVFGPTSGTGVQYETDLFGFSYDASGRPMAEAVWQQRCDSSAASTTGVQQGVLGHVMASGIMHAAGLIFASEISAGVIPHALSVTIPETLVYTDLGAFRRPANQTDGKTTPGVPMGAHVQLDPVYDISTLNATAQIVARALQLYGAYLVDTGGSLSFYAESSLTGAYPWWFDPHGVRAIDWTRLRVLDR